MQELILRAKEIIDESDTLAVLTGAGISAESGVPIFRGEEGLWNNYKPEEIASPVAFKRDPDLVWQWYDWRRSLINDAKPNQGHYAIAELERQKSEFTLITQNIDGLHQVAGSENVIEFHGNIWEIRCEECGLIEKNYRTPLEELPPKCSRCGNIARPNVVWFEEIIPMQVIDKSIMAIDQSDAMLIVGTSGIVEPAASMGLLAKQNGKKVIEVNLEITPYSAIYDVTINAKSGEILPLLYNIKSNLN